MSSESYFAAVTAGVGQSAAFDTSYSFNGSVGFQKTQFGGNKLYLHYTNEANGVAFPTLTVIGQSDKLQFRITDNTTTYVAIGVFGPQGDQIGWESLKKKVTLCVSVVSEVKQNQ